MIGANTAAIAYSVQLQLPFPTVIELGKIMQSQKHGCNDMHIKV